MMMMQVCCLTRGAVILCAVGLEHKRVRIMWVRGVNKARMMVVKFLRLSMCSCRVN